jgi:4-hydroxybenzoate decarboxylase subunit C
MRNLRELIAGLRNRKELVEIEAEVDPNLEIAEIHRRVAAADGPALLFKRIKGSSFPVVTNLFGSRARVDAAFPNHPERVVADLVRLFTHDFPPSISKLWSHRSQLRRIGKMGWRKVKKGPVCEVERAPDLESLPLLKCWPEDGGHFVTLPLVYTEPPGGGPSNLGMYRIQRFDQRTTGLHWQISKGGGYHYQLAEEAGLPLPVTIFIGGPPALILSAIAPLPENVPELLLAGFLQGGKLEALKRPESPYPLLAECEFAIVGESPPHERRLEGPFGDHYGYYSLEHPFPVFHAKRLFHRKDAIYPATVVGKPRQEDFYIGDYLQELLSPLFPVVMPSVRALWSYGETGFHSLSAAIVKERYYRECMSAAFRILGEGQLSLTKFLLLTDQPIDLRDFRQTLTTVLERFRPETDLFVFANLSLDTLDYTGPELNKGSRGVMLGIGEKIRDLPAAFTGPLPLPLREAAVFCPGCLVVEGEVDKIPPLLKRRELADWPLIVLVDDVKKAMRNEASFLWTTFTRFEPAADLHAKKSEVHRHHICSEGPILIDARMKPTYPPEVLCDAKTADLVDKRWANYFPNGMEMGPSDIAHV